MVIRLKKAQFIDDNVVLFNDVYVDDHLKNYINKYSQYLNGIRVNPMRVVK